MVVRIFIFALLSLSILSYLIPIEDKRKKSVNEDIAFLKFTDSTMYTLTTNSMHRIINSKEVLRYKNKDVMYEGKLTLKANDNNNKKVTDVLLSDVIIKRGDNFKFLNNVKYQRDDYITLNTNELLYNAKTRIATNTVAFDGTYFNNYIKGENIYLNLDKYHMKANKAHFEVEVEKK